MNQSLRFAASALAAVMLFAANDAAQAVVPARTGQTATIVTEKLGDDYISPLPLSSLGKQAKGPNRTIAPDDYQNVQFLKIDEDFSLLPEATVEEPLQLCEYSGLDASIDIPDEYTNQPGWTGSLCYAADQKMMLDCWTPNAGAYVRTPQGDYSGHVTVSFKMKFLPTPWQVEDNDGNPETVTMSKGILQVYPIAYNWHLAQTNLPESYGGMYNIQSSAEDGWLQVTLTFDNYSADAEGCIAFFTRYKYLIDDIHITTSADFLANPVMLKWTDVTTDGFTANWMPVDHAYDYYVFLFEEGVDEDGNPALKFCFDGLSEEEKENREEIAELYEMGLWDVGINYLYWGATYEGSDPKATSLTFSGLDPEKEYYVSVVAHRSDQWSEIFGNAYHVMVVPQPEQLSFSNFDETTGGYTAEWSEVVKADLFNVRNYGVNHVATANDAYPLFDGNFKAVEGYGCSVETPSMWVNNNDKVAISARIATEAQTVYVKFAGVTYYLNLTPGTYDYNFELPTNGQPESTLAFVMKDELERGFTIDHLSVSQAVAAGRDVFTLLETKVLSAGATSCDFAGVDNASSFDTFAFNVACYHEYLNPLTNQSESAVSAYMLPFLLQETTAGVEASEIAVETNQPSEAPVYYDLQGIRVANPLDGHLYIRVSNGKAAKIIK